MLLLSVLATVALAYPLNYPDHRRMGDYACVEHAVANENNIDLTEYVITDSPPGPPTFPADVQGQLRPFATDDAQKRAAKGKRIEARSAVATLAVGGRSTKLVCETDKPESNDEFRWGCEDAIGCTLYLPVKSGTKSLHSVLQVGSALGRVTSDRQALGLVALLDPGVFLPLTPVELEAWAETAQGYKALETDATWVELEKHDHGWLVRAPRIAECGCQKDLVRRAFWVSKDGRSCQVQEVPVPLAQATDPCPTD